MQLIKIQTITVVIGQVTFELLDTNKVNRLLLV